MFEVRPENGRNFKAQSEEKSETSSSKPVLDDSFKNNANRNSEIPDIIPDLPFHSKKNWIYLSDWSLLTYLFLPLIDLFFYLMNKFEFYDDI